MKALADLADEIVVDLGEHEGPVLAAPGDTIPKSAGYLGSHVSRAAYLQAMPEAEVPPEDVARTASDGAAAGAQAGPAGAGAGAPGASARMARFVLPDGVTLEIHIPRATGVDAGDSAATEAGFILRRGAKLVNVGPLARVLGL